MHQTSAGVLSVGLACVFVLREGGEEAKVSGPREEV
jgi:hypothetical protein